MANDIAGDAHQIIADLRRELEVRAAERDEALARETATAEVLAVINSSPGDLSPVFEAMLEKATRLCDAANGTLWLYDGERFRGIAVYGDPQYAAWLKQQESVRPVDMAPDRPLRAEQFVQIADCLAEEAYRTKPFYREMIDASRCRTALVVALRKDEQLLGIIIVYRCEVRPFTDQQIALLQNFAAQAVIAMENARLITETREALEQQTATAEVLQVINSSPGDLAPVFNAMLQKAVRLCSATHGILRIRDGELLHAVAVHGEPDVVERASRLPPINLADVLTHNLLLARIARGERWVHVADVRETDAYRDDPAARQRFDAQGVRTWLGVGLHKDGALLGTIHVHRSEVRPFSDRQIALLQNFAAQAVIAMENARLITETREALEQQTATAEVLGVINSSPGDLTPVFDAMLERAVRICEPAFGMLLRWDGERLHQVAWHGISPDLIETLRKPVIPRPGAPGYRLLQGEDIVCITDVTEDRTIPSDAPVRRNLARLGGRSYVAVALRKDDKLLGFIAIYRREVRPFSEKESALLQNFAAQAVIAIENARLLGELRERNDEIAGWNKELEARVAAQLAEIERTGKLRRFLAPQLAELILARGDESILESHRREIVVVFCDVRGFTSFAERAEPEEVMAFLRDYHAALGPIVAQFEGTLDHYSGDGIMVFFNDPLPTPEPAKRAIEMAVAMRETAQPVLRTWRRHGHDIGFGVGISQGYATLGQIGFAERMDYTAIGTVTNLAARLCAEAKDGQILISRRVAVAVEDSAKLEEIGDVSLKGLSQAVAVFNVV